MPFMKQWVWSGAANSRHGGVANEIVGVYEEFSNGMQYPGDAAGGIEQTAGCKCGLDVWSEGDDGKKEYLNPPASFKEGMERDGFERAVSGKLPGLKPPTSLVETPIEYYHTPKAFELNSSLRAQAELTAEQMRVVKGLDAGMVASAEERVLYRGLPDLGEVFGRTTVTEMKTDIGSVWSQRSYLSTSAQRDLADDFATGQAFGDNVPVIVRIVAPKGTPMLRVPEGPYGNQDEWLLPRGVKLTIKSIDKTQDPPVITMVVTKG